jgi:teichuronic acid biosynthesis glycosyltransferase TuaC
MRIAIVTTSWPSSEHDPAGHFVRAEARELEREGHEVSIVAPRAGGGFGWPGVGARLRARPWRAVEVARWISSARERVAALEVDRVVAHWAVPCAWPVGVAARSIGLEVVSHGADVRLIVAMPQAIRLRVTRAVAARARVWRFVSAALRDSLLGALDATTRESVERVALVRAARIDLPDLRWAAAAKRRDLGAGPIAVSVGRLVAGKRFERAIDYLARSADARVLVVVGDGPERRRLERLARTRGVDARFVGLVGRDEALAWIGAGDVLLHASEAEGLSTVVREAEALGTPVKVV